MSGAAHISLDIHIGTSGWEGKGWRKLFYPPSLAEEQWLPYYADHFDTVELTATFRRLPEEAHFQKWRQQVPEGFTFLVRAPRRICHRKRLRGCERDIEAFLDRIRLLGPHLGPVIWELPPTFKCEVEALAAFLPQLPGDMIHVVEFRHASWHRAAVRELLEEHGVAMMMHDHDGRRTPWWITGPVVVFRLNGMQAQRRCYGAQGLEPFVEQMELALQMEQRPVFVIFGDDAEGCAVRDASILQHLLGRRPAHLPALDMEQGVPIAIATGEDFAG